MPTRLTDEQLTAKAAETADTSGFKKDGPYKIGVSAGYLSNSWVVFALQHVRWEASQHPEISRRYRHRCRLQPGQAGLRHRRPAAPGHRSPDLLAGR